MRPKTELLRERNHKTALLDFFQYLGISVRLTGVGLVAQVNGKCWVFADDDTCFIEDLAEERKYVIEQRSKYPHLKNSDLRNCPKMIELRQERIRKALSDAFWEWRIKEDKKKLRNESKQ